MYPFSFRCEHTTFSKLIVKSGSFILPLFLLISPLSVVFAQETSLVSPQVGESSVVDENESTQTEYVNEEESINGLDENAIKEEQKDYKSTDDLVEETPLESQSMMTTVNDQGDLTSVEGYTKNGMNNIIVDENSGALQYSYKFTIPEGRGKTTPDLSLEYSNQTPSDSDIFGYGWRFSLPYIEILNKEGIDKFYSTSSETHYSSSLSGELVRIATSTVYQAKIDHGEFLRYEFVNGGWQMTDKTGTRYFFGSASSSRQDNPTNSNEVAKWMLSKVEDTNGNYAVYSYSKSVGTIYPSSIEYTKHAVDEGLFEINFDLSTTTPKLSYEKGFPATRKYVVSAVHILVDTVSVRTYDLRYEDGLNENRDLLYGITESGYQNGSTTTLPEIVFAYDGDWGPAWTTNKYAGTFPEPLSSKDTGVRFGDLNGDGLTDVVRYYQRTDSDSSNEFDYRIRRVHINKGNGVWDYDVDWDWDDIRVPFVIAEDGVTGSSFYYHDMGTRLIDVNGDGRDDLVVSYYAPQSYHSYPTKLPLRQQGVYLNTGSGFELDSSWSGLEWFNSWHDGRNTMHNQGTIFLDINNDGLPDIVTAYFVSYSNGSPNANTVSSVKLNTGTGWESSNLSFPVPLAQRASPSSGHRSFGDVGTRLADVNGDGLIDVLRGSRQDRNDPTPEIDDKTVYLNTGNGWATSSDWSLPEYFYIGSISAPNTGYSLVDINGDRLVDIVKAGSSGNEQFKFYLNTGNGWVEEDYELPFYLTTGSSGVNNGTALLDFDGDTIVDGINLNYLDTYETHTAGGSAIINNAPIPDQLTNITLSQGGIIDVTLDGYADIAQENYETIGTIAGNPVVVSEVKYDSGSDNEWNVAYNYADASYYYASSTLQDRRNAGFGLVIRTDDSSRITSRFHQGDENATSTFELADEYEKIGLKYRSEAADVSGDVFSIQMYKYATSSLVADSTFVKLERQTTVQYDGDADHKDSATEYLYSDTRGSVMQKVDWGEVDANADGTFSDVAGDQRTHTYTYASNSLNNILAIPSSEVKKNALNATTSVNKYYYDNLSLNLIDEANITKNEQWATSSSYIDYEWTYDNRGLKLTEKDPRNNVTTYLYDPHYLYIATSTNPLAHSTHYEYDYSSGKVVRQVNPNNYVEQFVYDGFDRVIEVAVSDPQTGAIATTSEITYDDTAGDAVVHTENHLDSTMSTHSYAYLDGFGRPIQNRLSGEVPTQFIVKDYLYGDNGLRTKESLPYFGNGSAKTSATNKSPLYAEYEYDALGRTIAVNTAAGSTVTSYDQWTKTMSDTLGNQKDYTYDAYGRLIVVTEHNDGNSYVTQYKWDANSNLLRITDALNNIRNSTYDGLSRRTSLEDLHESGDNTFGTCSFVYDASGNLTTQTDPKGQVVNYSYDDSNRPITENYTGDTGTEVTYSYDSCANGVGYVCSVASDSVTTNYAYNYRGKVASESKTISGTSYTTEYMYDWLNNPTLIAYPDGSEVSNTYNTGNQIESIRQRESGGSYKDIIQDFDYGPHGQITYQLFGNGASTTKTYDENELYRLKNIKTDTSEVYGVGGSGNEVLSIVSDSTSNEREFIEPITTPNEMLNADAVTGLHSASESVEATEVKETAEVSNDQIITTTDQEAEGGVLVDNETSLAIVSTTTDNIQKDNASENSKLLPNGTSTATTSTERYIKFASTTEMQLAFQSFLEESKVSPIVFTTSQLSIGIALPLGQFNIVIDKNKVEGSLTDFPIYIDLADLPDEFWDLFIDECFGIRVFKEDAITELPQDIVSCDPASKSGEMYVKYTGQLSNATNTVLVFGIDGEHSHYNDTDIYGSNAVWSDYVGVWHMNGSSKDSSGNGNGVDTSMTYGTSYGKMGQGALFNGTSSRIYAGTNRNVTNGVTISAWAQNNTTASMIAVAKTNFVSPATDAWYLYRPYVSSQSRLEGHTRIDSTNYYHAPTGDVPISTMQYLVMTHDRANMRLYAGGGLHSASGSQAGSSIGNNSGSVHIGAGGSGPSLFWSGNMDEVRISGIARNADWIATEYSNQSNSSDFYSVVQSSSTATTTVPYTAGGIQNLHYAYDAVGNIIEIIDTSETLSSGVITYQYDDLYRLVSASTTMASTSGYLHTYAYDPLGNLVSKSDVGTFDYEGSAGSSYANPHAVTDINGVTYSYDNNGNLITTSVGASNTWDYRNRLTESTESGTTTIYGYDHSGARVFKDNGTAVTYYPFSNYEVSDTGTTTKHIYANDMLLATIEDSISTPELYYNHLDHLQSTAVVTNVDGSIAQLLAYYPYGDARIEEQYGDVDQAKRYTGHTYDEETELTYAGARYLNSNIGKWISMDPASRDTPQQFLRDPQQLNSYSYARNNPLIFVDPNGEAIRAINRPVEKWGITVGAHSFIEITDNPNINNGQRTTLGGYTENFITGDLFKAENYHTDYDLTESDYLSTHDIVAPSPYTPQGFEEKVYESYQNLDSNYGAYSPLGGDFIKTGQGNSGNVFNQILSDSGLSQEQINSYKTNGYYDAGVGRGVPSGRVQSLPTIINNLKNQVQELSKKLKERSNNN